MRIWFVLSMLVLGGTFAGCAHKGSCTTPLDNPSYYYLSGMEALETGKVAVAEDKFDRALSCNSKFGIANDGLALVAAEKARTQPGTKAAASEASRAKNFLEKAKKIAKTPDELFDYQLAVLRVKAATREPEWLPAVEAAYTDAAALKVDEKKLGYYQGTEALDYFLGRAYLETMNLEKARDSFAKVLKAKQAGKWRDAAEKEWTRVDRIVRAVGSMDIDDLVGKILVKKTVSRADMAALMVSEMKIDSLMAGRMPTAAPLDPVKVEAVPTDVEASPQNKEIVSLMKWQVRGMVPQYDEKVKGYLFRPADPMRRGDLAVALEDVLVKLTGNEKIAKAHLRREKSPFPDVKLNSPYFNAVMNMTTRGIMTEERSGVFRVNDPVDGVEAIQAVRMFRERVNIR